MKIPKTDSTIIQLLVLYFWYFKNGKKQAEELQAINPEKDMRLWIKAHLMSMIDESYITFD